MTIDIANCQYIIRFCLEKRCRQPFKPPRNLMLSVNIECNINDLKENVAEETWKYGLGVAEYRNKNEGRNSIKLSGGARLSKETIENEDLVVAHAEVKEEDDAPTNPYHANITNWPNDKDEQMNIYRKLLSEAEILNYEP